MNGAEAYPLAWPDGWPRTSPSAQIDGRGRFSRGGGNKGWWTFAEARDALLDEVSRLSGRAGVMSANFPLDRYGRASGGKGRPADQGVAVYFTVKGKPYVMACDRYTRAEENMRSLALAIEAMRTLERHGGGVMMEKAFQGFAALPPPKSCWELLGVQPGVSEAEVRAAWRRRIGEAHPDQGGSEAAASALNAARDDALKLIGSRP